MGSIIFLIVLFFCVLLRCIQKSICVRPVTHLMATGMACTKNPFAWSVHARAAVCMVWAQWYTAHLTRPDGIPVPIDVEPDAASGVSTVIPIVDEYFVWSTVVNYTIVTVGIAVIRASRVWGIMERVLMQQHVAVTLRYALVQSKFKLS